jgi:hypothetical protein
MAKALERVRMRTPSVKSFVRRALADRRNVQYDLLPFLGSVRGRDLVAGLVRVGLPRTPHFQPSSAALAYAEQLRSQGYTDAIRLVTPAQAQALLAYFKHEPVRDPRRPHLGDCRWDEPPSPETTTGHYRAEQILAAPDMLKIFNAPVILDLAEIHLGCKPTLDTVSCRWTYSRHGVAQDTERYRRDWDSIKGFKILIYLTDVDERAGPHGVIAGSHRSDRLMEMRAMSDDEVHAAFGPAAERRFSGAAGTGFVVDTFGIHKGWPPTRHHRLTLFAHYNLTPSPYGPKRPIAQSRERLSRHINRLYVVEPGGAISSDSRGY